MWWRIPQRIPDPNNQGKYYYQWKNYHSGYCLSEFDGFQGEPDDVDEAICSGTGDHRQFFAVVHD